MSHDKSTDSNGRTRQTGRAMGRCSAGSAVGSEGSGRGFGAAISLPPAIEQCLCHFKSCINTLFLKECEDSIAMEVCF